AILAGQANAANTGAYAGLDVGASTLGTPSDNIVTGEDGKLFKQSHDRTGFAGRVFAGYNFNPYIGLEAGITKYATAHYNSSLKEDKHTKGSQDYSLVTCDLVAKAYLPISDSGFNLYALGGAALVHSHNTGKLYNKDGEVKKYTES